MTPKVEEGDLLLKQNEDGMIARLKMFIHLRQDLERVRSQALVSCIIRAHARTAIITAVFKVSLSLSLIPSQGVSHCPDQLQVAPEASWVG